MSRESTAQKVGFLGFQADPTPRHNYAFGGQTQDPPADTPETSLALREAARQVQIKDGQSEIPASWDLADQTPDYYEDDVEGATVQADRTYEFAEIDNEGTVTAVVFTPKESITGADTNTRKVELKKGSTVIAAKTFDAASGTSGAGTPKTLTISNGAVKEGDDLTWVSTHLGTGKVDPGGRVKVTVTPTVGVK